jgi:hypothetical protein
VVGGLHALALLTGRDLDALDRYTVADERRQEAPAMQATDRLIRNDSHLPVADLSGQRLERSRLVERHVNGVAALAAR